MHLKLRREHKGNYMKWEKARWGLDYRIVKIMCSLEGGYAFEGYYFWQFKDVLTLIHKDSGQGSWRLGLA